MPRLHSSDHIDFTEQVALRADICAQLDKAIVRCKQPHNLIGSPLFIKLLQLLAQTDTVLVAHYYVDANLQALAEQSGGFVGDSLQMAAFGASAQAKNIVVAGVRFMAETAKILAPEKKVHIIDLEAECSLDLACPPEAFSMWCEQYPDRTVVVYANTSATIKAQADWVVTSSIAKEVIEHLADDNQKIIWAPDKHLGRYLQQQTQADMLLWDGACVVHEEFKTQAVRSMQHLYPDAALLAHPESPQEILDLADAVGSTSQLIQSASDLPHSRLIVATDSGIFYKMQQAVPHKTLIIAPTAGFGATCKSCAHCPWMGLNDLERLDRVLMHRNNEITLDTTIIQAARVPLNRMLDFARSLQSA